MEARSTAMARILGKSTKLKFNRVRFPIGDLTLNYIIMTQEDKDLLLKDLCARIPYGVKVFYEYVDNLNKKTYGYSLTLNTWCIDEMKAEKAVVKPYLFPLSSMTEEQKKYISNRWGVNEDFDFEIDPNWGKYFVDLGDAVGFINWCYENHFDINDLIPKGLAIDNL